MRNPLLAMLLGALCAAGCGSNSETTSSAAAGSGGSSGSAGSGSGASSGSSGSAGAAGSSGCVTTVKPEKGTVITASGAVTGTKVGTTWAFKGIPYAAPPVGELRWKRPQAAACWTDALAAKEFGPACAQLDTGGNVTGVEDCLTANLWVPEDATADNPVPVLFFIHGGGNVQGSSSNAVGATFLYDGQALSERGHVAVVTINYRLGPFGWLAHPAFAEGSPAASGNYGALDQIFALQWLRGNIAAFAGDAARVLVFGESAGAVNTCLVLASPLAKGLFSAALMESGGCAAQSKDAAQKFAEEWAAMAGCDKDADPAACMRKMPFTEVESLVPAPPDVAGKQGPYQPNVDGHLLTALPYEMLKAGEHNHVPLIVGANEHETGAVVMAMSEAEYEAAVKLAFPGVSDLVLNEYPVAGYPTPRDAYVALTSDIKFICSARRTARAAAAAQKEAVYRYQFTHVLDNVGAVQKEKGSFHGLELFFVFDHLGVAGYTPSAGEKDLAAAIGGYWSRFGGSGDPNGGGAVTWPVYDAAKDSYLKLDSAISAGAGVHTDKCDFWDSLLPP